MRRISDSYACPVPNSPTFEVVAAGYPPRTAAVSCVELAAGAGAAGMVGGQVLDLEAEGRIEASRGREPPDSLTAPQEPGGSRPRLARYFLSSPAP